MVTKLRKKQIFHEFCEWLKMQSAVENSIRNVDSDIRLKQYEENLRNLKIDESRIEAQLNIIKEALFKIDIERWNKFYADNERNGKSPLPNKFMAEIVNHLPIGTALDIGMGQGRNALYLARKGWKTTGLEASKEGASITMKQAEMQNLKITAIHTDYEKYDLGKNHWDLILLLYVPLKNIAGKVIESLSKKGRVIVEAYHSDSRDVGTFGDKVAFDSDKLPEIFKSLNIYVYEEKVEINDFGNVKVPIVRLYAGRLPKS